ncbi:MAG: hemolysin III family protein [Chitinophagales bacterium]|nr:hemolysin III family protein [Chitinophagales bacterium]
MEHTTAKQERANYLTHLAGIVFCVVAIPVLTVYAGLKGTAGTMWAVCIFGFGMFTVYLSSTLYHAAEKEQLKRVLRVWDHISIFFLIAGSYTPFVVKFIKPDTALLFLSIMWGIVVVGIIKKLFFTGRLEFLSVMLYLGMGWMAVFILKPMLQTMPLEIFWWILAGGLFYTLGIVFYVWKRWKYHHAIWHCFVLGGTVSHYFAVLFSVPVNTKL